MNINRVTSVRDNSGARDVAPVVESIMAHTKSFGIQSGYKAINTPGGFGDSFLKGCAEGDLESYVDTLMGVYDEMEGVEIRKDVLDATRQTLMTSLNGYRKMADGVKLQPETLLGIDMEDFAGGAIGWGSVSNYGHVTGPIIAATMPTSFASQVIPVSSIKTPRTTFEINIDTIHYADGNVMRAEDLGYYNSNLGAFGENPKAAIAVVAGVNDSYVADLVGGSIGIKAGVPGANLVGATGSLTDANGVRKLYDHATLKIVGVVVAAVADGSGAVKIDCDMRPIVSDSDSRAQLFTGSVVEGGDTFNLTVKVVDIDKGDIIIMSASTNAARAVTGIIPEFTLRNNQTAELSTRQKYHQRKEQLLIRSAPLIHIPFEPQMSEDINNMSGIDDVATQIEKSRVLMNQALETRSIQFVSSVVAGGIGKGIFSEAKGQGGSKDFVYTASIDLKPPANLQNTESIREYAENKFASYVKELTVKARMTTRERDVTWYFITDPMTNTMIPKDKSQVISGPSLGKAQTNLAKDCVKLYKGYDGINDFYIVDSDFLGINHNMFNANEPNPLRSTAFGDTEQKYENGVIFGFAVPNKMGAAGDVDKTLEYLTYSVNMVEGVVSQVDKMNQGVNIYNRDMFVNYRPVCCKLVVTNLNTASRFSAAP